MSGAASVTPPRPAGPGRYLLKLVFQVSDLGVVPVSTSVSMNIASRRVLVLRVLDAAGGSNAVKSRSSLPAEPPLLEHSKHMIYCALRASCFSCASQSSIQDELIPLHNSSKHLKDLVRSTSCCDCKTMSPTMCFDVPCWPPSKSKVQ